MRFLKAIVIIIVVFVIVQNYGAAIFGSFNSFLAMINDQISRFGIPPIPTIPVSGGGVAWDQLPGFVYQLVMWFIRAIEVAIRQVTSYIPR